MPSVCYPHMLVLAVLHPLVVEQVAVARVELAPRAGVGECAIENELEPCFVWLSPFWYLHQLQLLDPPEGPDVALLLQQRFKGRVRDGHPGD